MKPKKRVQKWKGGLMLVKIAYYNSQISKEKREIIKKEKLIREYEGELKRLRKAKMEYKLTKEKAVRKKP